MRRIYRADEPWCLIQLRQVDPTRRWDSGGAPDVHTTVQDKLRIAQDGCCAYCERRLTDSPRVEHIHPRSAKESCSDRPSPNHHYDWNNLLVVCTGNGTCDEAKMDRHLCTEILFPDRLAEEQVFLVDPLNGGLIVNPDISPEIQAKAKRTIDELRLDDINLRSSRLAVVLEFHRRFFDEDDRPDLISFEMRGEGFPTTVEAMRRNFL
jgi:uncharacterized protein (TIGR02646 family)